MTNRKIHLVLGMERLKPPPHKQDQVKLPKTGAQKEGIKTDANEETNS